MRCRRRSGVVSYPGKTGGPLASVDGSKLLLDVLGASLQLLRLLVNRPHQMALLNQHDLHPDMPMRIMNPVFILNVPV